MMGMGMGGIGQAAGGGMPDGLPPGIDTPEQMLAFLEEIQRQGGNIDEIVPPDLAVSNDMEKAKETHLATLEVVAAVSTRP